MSNDQEFVRCLEAFARHEYAACAVDTHQLLGKRLFQWLMQLHLISLERDYRYEHLEKVTPVALECFAEHPWAIALLKLTLGLTTADEIRHLAKDAKSECQLLFYEASALLTRGAREAASACFERCASLEAECAEHFLARSERDNPEPHAKTFERLVYRARRLNSMGLIGESRDSARSAVKYHQDHLGSDNKEEAWALLFELCRILGEEVGDENNPSIFVNIKNLSVHELPPIADETNFFRLKYNPPFVQFAGSGKRIASNLTPLQTLALSFAFPAFTGRATIDREGAAEPEWAERVRKSQSYDESIQRQLNKRKFFRRRYSGDVHGVLPREKYFSLYAEASEVPTYTLLGEMNAYAIPLKTGYCAAIPGVDGNSIRIIFRGLPNEPNPFYSFLTAPERYSHLWEDAPNDPRKLISPQMLSLVSAETEYVFSVPCVDVEIQLERAFDLRQSAAREWMVDFFKNPPPAITDEDLAHGDFLRHLASEYEVDLSQIVGWHSLLPITSAKTFGGNGMTDLFALFLRTLGCDGLIFPSARCDYSAVFVDGALVDHWGWNLVDYRGAPIPEGIAYEEVSTLEPLEGVNHFAEVRSGSQAGSIVHLGGSFYTRLTNQSFFDQYVALCGSEWRMAHSQRELTVRGYCWFERSFSPGGDGRETIVCATCKAGFPLNPVALSARCPHCGFGGDLGVFVNVAQFFHERLRAV